MDILEVGSLVVSVIINLLLAAFIYLRNRRSASYRLFALLVIISSFWGVTNYFAVNSQDPVWALWLVRGVLFFATPMSVVFFFLMHTFPRTTMSLSRKTLVIWIALTLLTMAVALSPYLFTKVTLISGAAPSPVPGPGMLIFVPIGIGTIPLGFYYLIRKLRKAKGIERVQMEFLLMGVVVMFTLIIFFNFLSVVLFQISKFNKFGSLFTLPFTGLTAYSMIRYRLMDIKFAVFRILSTTALIGAVLLVYGLLILFAVPWVSMILGISNDIVAAGAALISIPVAQFVRRLIMKWTDKFLFQSRFDYQKALVAIAQNLAGTIKIEEVTTIVLDTLTNILRSSKVVVLLQDEHSKEFIPAGLHGVKDFSLTIPTNNPILVHLKHTQAPIVKDELDILREQDISKEHSKEIETIENGMAWLDVSVIVPLFVNRVLTGILLLGDKLSGQPYLQDDIEFLNALAPQAATALENARLYKESLEFGQRLRTEVEAATKELATANEQLKALDKAKSEFLSIASHQLYTPLTALRGYISMLIEGDFGPMNDKQTPVLDILNKSATRLIELIKNLLDISRIESGRLELNLVSVDLVKMAEELVTDLMPNARAKGLKLDFIKQKETLPHVVADEQRLRQVMLNFIDNSIKYTPKGWIKVTLHQEGDEIFFSVQDSGKGLAHEEISQLFNKFTRVGGASRFHTEGTGLGLYVAKQIIHEHRGEVAADSPGKDQGSTFSLRLPIEGSSRSLKLGEKASVVIKAADATGASQET